MTEASILEIKNTLIEIKAISKLCLHLHECMGKIDNTSIRDEISTMHYIAIDKIENIESSIHEGWINLHSTTSQIKTPMEGASSFYQVEEVSTCS